MMDSDKEDVESINNKDFQVAKAEHIHNWCFLLTVRLFNEVVPLFISIVIAFIVALLSSNFDHLMKISLETLETFGVFRYLMSIVFLCVATLVVHVFHPTVRGSGIPEMKLFLENWESPRMKDYLTSKAMVIKTIGLGLAILSGFPVGKEGPFVHISCAISYFVKFKVVPIFTSLIITIYHRILLMLKFNFTKTIKHHYMCWKLNYFRDVDVYRFLCTGCALGVACTFGAPIGGVMFSIEVTSQIFDISNYWQCFFTGMVGALFFRFFIGGVFHENWYFKPFLESNIQDQEYELHHFFVYIGIGVACGILGSVFILIYFVFFKAGQIYYRILNYFFRKFPTKNTFKWSIFHSRTSPRRIIVTLIFTLSISVVLCVGEFIQNQDSKMPLSQHSQLTLFFDDDEKLLQHFQIKTNGNGSNKPEIDIQLNLNNYFKPLLLFLLMKILFFCPIVTCLPIPSGIFFPLTVTGACLGRLLGDLTKINSAGCAIVGAAGLSGAVTHSVSTAVIITEMTEEIQYLLPCAIAAFIGKLIVQIFAKYSIYNMIMRNRRMPYMPDEDEEIYSIFKKTDAATFFTSGNYVSVGDKTDGKRYSLVLYCDLKDEVSSYNSDLTNLPNSSSKNGDLRYILSTIRGRSSEIQWKLIPVMRSKNAIETLIGYVKCEAAARYLQKYFALIIGNISYNEWWLKDPTELSKIIEKDSDKKKCFLHFCGTQYLEFQSNDWENFLTEEINWEELLEEKPCSVTIKTILPNIQTFVQRNFLPQVFVLDGVELRGLITRENIIEQIKLLHRQSGTLAVSYRGDLQSLPMKIIHPDQIQKMKSPTSNTDRNSTSQSKYDYIKLRTHSE